MDKYKDFEYVYYNRNYILSNDLVLPSKLNSHLYEFIRILNGTPVFFDRHIARFRKTLELSEVRYTIDEQEIMSKISNLTELNNISEANCIIELFVGEKTIDILIYNQQAKKIDDEMLKNGVSVGIIQHTRNIPNTKFVDLNFKEQAENAMKKKGYFEVLIENENGEIPEGSYSNVYYIKEKEIIYAPDNAALKGITKSVAEEYFLESGCKITRRNLKTDEIGELDGAFITSTAFGVIGISAIEGIKLNNEVAKSFISKLILFFMNNQKKYLKNFKKV